MLEVLDFGSQRVRDRLTKDRTLHRIEPALLLRDFADHLSDLGHFGQEARCAVGQPGRYRVEAGEA